MISQEQVPLVVKVKMFYFTNVLFFVSLQVAVDNTNRRILWSPQKLAYHLIQKLSVPIYIMYPNVPEPNIFIIVQSSKMYQYSFYIYKVNILMQGNDIERNSGPILNKFNMTSVLGNLYQGDHREFQARSVGKQCVANSIIAIIYSTVLPLKNWEAKNLDAILRSGDRLYSRINSKQHDYLLMNDFPDVITEYGEQYSIGKNGEMFGWLTKGQFDGIGQELHFALKSMVQHNKNNIWNHVHWSTTNIYVSWVTR